MLASVITQDVFEKAHADYWLIETFHLAMKQVCNIEKFQVGIGNAIK